MIDKLLPRFTYRRLIVRMALNWLQGRGALRPRLKAANWRHYSRYRNAPIRCNVCGEQSRSFFDFPDLDRQHEHRIGELRETLCCVRCGATMRNRTLATAMLRVVSARIGRPLQTIREAAEVSFAGLRVLDTDSFSPISAILQKVPTYSTSSFIPGQPFDVEIAPNRFNVNLENMGFPDDKFDIVISSDVMEHVRDIDAAHSEIARIIKPGGHYIFTVPYDADCNTHHILVDTEELEDRYLVSPQYHGDPLTGGILAYRVFGRALYLDLSKLGFDLEFLRVDDSDALIVNGDVFIARMGATATVEAHSLESDESQKYPDYK